MMNDAWDTMLYVIVLVLSVLGTHGTPTMSMGFPSFATFTTFSGRRDDDRAAIKPFSGFRVQNDSFRMVYYHMQTVAVVELGPGKLLLNCELIEVYDPEDAMHLLHDLSVVSRPLMVSFAEMMTLMGQCQLVDPPQSAAGPGGSRRDVAGAAAGLTTTDRRGLLANNPFTLFSGIIPGTKWCGTGDIASNYHDLGKDVNMDKCCRTHDLCPLKIRAYSNRYNLTNNSLYSKSHCQCDDSLYECLKRVDTQTSKLMGNIYFNIVQVPCIEEISGGKRRFKNARSNF